MTLPDLIIGICLFCGLLALGTVALELLLDSPEHIDARERNRHEDVGEVWWRG